LQTSAFGQTGHAVLVNADGQLLVTEDEVRDFDQRLTDVIPLLEDQPEDDITVTTDNLGQESVTRVAALQSPESGVLDNLGWYVVVYQTEEEAFAPVTDAANSVLLPVIGLVVLIAIISLLVLNWLFTPLNTLTQAAQRLAAQDWQFRANVKRNNEFGQLALAVNTMAEQLESTIGTMQQNIDRRTRDLQTVVHVSEQIATILNVERLLQDVVDLTKERFGLYHAHIYLLSENTLRLTAGAGHVGRQMVSQERQIDLYNPQSLVAEAARNRDSIVINNVYESPTFLPHPLLPETQAEMAVPLIARGRVLGVLDVQANQTDFFDDTSLDILQTLSGQIANALSNAQLYQQAERAGRHEQALSAISQQIQSAQDIEDVLRITVRELGKALRVPQTAIELKTTGNGGD
jgi:putative methionine-R-sulfoxide reductase with GAF domain